MTACPGTEPISALFTRPGLASVMKSSASAISGSIDRRHSKSVSTYTPPSRQRSSSRRMFARSAGARSFS